ncbi:MULTISPECIES: DUF3592 domain-containing protein [Nocardia]|uniref:DUF3592 domain-containing protein n=1 Tax=Nocardia nova TaxID=37330 RepID=A0A2S6A076_9NOCA|nr:MULTISPECIES: DUF3592 domain-containing protein [Nocardia]OBF83567.1 DUF3592 domain-containing protein [Mycobacterium sp. 852002-51759_SCH5129042]MBF6274815.1 DUF3592 domain-containing protein [Nocardia nova]OBA54286.1 DUF3592 domain-containing protein [Nocardia sp. 852002-51101_SCH5132738]OBB29580.1 DUF3592 domain-containing protein [Nocardia sp. 852002-51244_SCH5132740]PPJ24458.1 DUF3592 domain-containing protein [Nocardia nova]
MSETTESAAREHRAVAGSPRLRRTRITLVVIATAVSVLAVLLVLAAWRDDMLISSDKGVTSAEVLSAGRLRSAVTYVTPDGVTHNPKVGVLYPTKLTAGERINVEYSRSDPELVRVAGRDARVAVIPALSVIVVVWVVALPVLLVVRRFERRSVRTSG